MECDNAAEAEAGKAERPGLEAPALPLLSSLTPPLLGDNEGEPREGAGSLSTEVASGVPDSAALAKEDAAAMATAADALHEDTVTVAAAPSENGGTAAQADLLSPALASPKSGEAERPELVAPQYLTAESFMRELQSFFHARDMELKVPKFYGVEVDLHKLWCLVTSLGGYEKVTSSKQWRVVGDHFDPPKSCTTLSFSFRSFYEKALLEYEKHMGPISGLNLPPISGTAKSAEGHGGRPAKRGGARTLHRGDKSGEAANENDASPEQRVGGTPAKRPRRQHEGALVDSGMEISPPANMRLGTAGEGHPGGPSGGRLTTAVDPSARGRDQPLNGKGQQLEPAAVISDEGPPADWVRINVRRSPDCFEIYALVPGLVREEVRVQCEGGGKLIIAGEPEQPENPWGVTAFRKAILLPTCINAHQTSAVVTLHGQLYVRAPFASTAVDAESHPPSASNNDHDRANHGPLAPSTSSPQ